jgi:transcription initiation factor TFIIH subunit 1
MLQEDPNLFQLYKNLVVSGVVSAEDFWANRVNKEKEASVVTKQDIGISAAFLVSYHCKN